MEGMAAQSLGCGRRDQAVVVPLRRWIRDEAQRRSGEERSSGAGEVVRVKQRSLLRKAAIALGIAELLIHHSRQTGVGKGGNDGDGDGNGNDNKISGDVIGSSNGNGNKSNDDNGNGNDSGSNNDKGKKFGLDDYAVLVTPSESSWMDVGGVQTTSLSAPLSVRLTEPFYVTNLLDENVQDRMGRYLEAEISRGDDGAPVAPIGNSSNNNRRSFGMFLYELCSGMRPLAEAEAEGESPWSERSTVRYDKRKGKSHATMSRTTYTTLRELGHPSSLCQLMQDLMDGRAEYPSLEAARDDLHLMIRDPDCFLFDAEDALANAPSRNVSSGGAAGLRIRRDKLYGREGEVAMITDAFCRVSSGEDAAFFIGGYSGSGKTMLVQSLIARVDVAGGYVLTQKVDHISRDRPLLGVLSVFDELCLVIKDESSPDELLTISEKLKRDFEADYAVLARLVPNIDALFPQQAKTTEKVTSDMTMNVNTVSFTLQRFVRIVSSRQKPVMLFYDDLQWAARPTLKLIEALLTDARGPSCFFFVGSYRDNEVGEDHPVLDLISTLESHSVHTTKLSLRGLRQGDLNTMVAEMLGVLPRLCRTLSDIVFEKTEGNPLFALEFMRSLVENRLLKYSLRDRRWIWEEKRISQEDITDNVLYLLTAKMKSLPENIQSALKLLSCFGIRTIEPIVDYLSSTPQYPDLRHCLDECIHQGCLIKSGSEFKFVHDKVREAAYGLIPLSDKRKFHFDIGMLLYSATKGQELGNTIYPLADQLNHGTPSLIQPDMRTDITKLNVNTGLKAMNRSDFATALSYFNRALELLEQVENHWGSQYELCLELFYLHAKATYSCGNIEKAYVSLKNIVQKGQCMEDKLDAYHFYGTILLTCGESDDAYTLCESVLSHLNESIPQTIDMKMLMVTVKKTGQLLAGTSAEDLLNAKEIDGLLCHTLKFYHLLTTTCFFKQPEKMAFFVCRIVQITLENGVCDESVFGLSQYASVLLQTSKEQAEIRELCRVANAAMSLFKQRYDKPDLVPKLYLSYYGFASFYTEPFQAIANHLRKGFDVGISSGDPASAFFISMRIWFYALVGGEELSTMASEVDQHLEILERSPNQIAKICLSSFRETFSVLLDSEHSMGSSTNEHNINETHKIGIYFNKMIQSFWLGHSSRCHHYAKKLLALRSIRGLARLLTFFYAALNAFRGIKNTNGNGSVFIKAIALYKDARSELQNAAEICPGNYRNKVYLLEAEQASFEKKYEDAKALYAAAITSSRMANLVHEHGLAYEHAALHYKRIGETQMSLDLFRQAKSCYKEWGSNLKVKSITQLMDGIASGHQL